MKTHTLESVLREHPFLQEMREDHIALLAGCASNVRFASGDPVLREGEDAAVWYLLRTGRVALEIYTPGAGSVEVGLLGDGDVLGWSWFVPPYRWHLDARAIESTRAVALDAVCLRGKCDADKDLGYALLKRCLRAAQNRFEWTQMRLFTLGTNDGQ